MGRDAGYSGLISRIPMHSFNFASNAGPRAMARSVVRIFAAVGLSQGVSVASATQMAAAQPVEFNEIFLQRHGGSSIDVSRFNRGNVVMPGKYRVDLYLNDNWVGRVEVDFRQMGEAPGAQPCFDKALLNRLGVDLSKAPEILVTPGVCYALTEVIPQATVDFDAGDLRLNLTVPQAMLNNRARGYVDPENWDDGITAGYVNYNANTYSSSSSSQSNTQTFAGINAGMNAGPWRFRHSGNYTHSRLGGGGYQSTLTNLSRAIVPLKSQLVIGDAFTNGEIFDSFGFRGVKLASDTRMFPESQRDYAPIVRGVASSNAKVQIRQNRNVIYETTVAPGPFEINDLYATGYGGDLEVIVTEADGRVLVSRVPFAAPVNAVREGVTNYSLTLGTYRNRLVNSKPGLAQATVRHGFSNTITGYGGLMLSPVYHAGNAGVALNTGLGAFGVDITQASAEISSQETRRGHSVRLSYGKWLEPTSTSISIAAYRYSSRGYLGFEDAMSLRDLHTRGQGTVPDLNRNRFQAILNQSLPDGYGSFSLSGSIQNYWNRSGRDTQYTVGYANSYRRLNYSVTAGRRQNFRSGEWDNQVMVNLNFPLSFGSHTAYASTNFQRESNGRSSLQQSVGGALGEDHGISYSLNAGRSTDGSNRTNSVGANVNYSTPVTALSASASKSGEFTQRSFGMSGGVFAYSGGVVLTPSSGETAAILEAKGAGGARVTSNSGLRLDPWGRTVVQNLVPFSNNDIALDPKGLPLNVELLSTEQRVVPTAGAILRVPFETKHAGRAVIFSGLMHDGRPLPFGARVLDVAGNEIGVVAQGSRIIAQRIEGNQGILTVRWGEQAQESCAIDYSLPEAKNSGSNPFVTVSDVKCRPAVAAFAP
jgi:outer membrane usher protein